MKIARKKNLDTIKQKGIIICIFIIIIILNCRKNKFAAYVNKHAQIKKLCMYINSSITGKNNQQILNKNALNVTKLFKVNRHYEIIITNTTKKIKNAISVTRSF